MSPFFQRPLALGADIVVHSTTKFLNGHSDSVGGVAVVKDEKHARVAAVRAERGGRDPLALRLLARAPRARRPSTCACPATRRTPARWRPSSTTTRRCERVLWPGFPDHPGHAVHKRQASGFGAVISFDLGSLEAARRLLGRRPPLLARREPRRGRDAHLAPGHDDPRRLHAGRARRARHHERPRPHQRRLRGRGRPRGRPRAGPGRGLAGAAVESAVGGAILPHERRALRRDRPPPRGAAAGAVRLHGQRADARRERRGRRGPLRGDPDYARVGGLLADLEGPSRAATSTSGCSIAPTRCSSRRCSRAPACWRARRGTWPAASLRLPALPGPPPVPAPRGAPPGPLPRRAGRPMIDRELVTRKMVLIAEDLRRLEALAARSARSTSRARSTRRSPSATSSA